MAFTGFITANKAVPTTFGLFSVADVTNRGSGDEHWISGFDAESEICSFNASIVDICGGPDVPVLTSDDEAARFRKVFPFGIKASDECLSVGWAVQDRRARVKRQLELVTQKAVEVELWNGLYAQQAANGGQYLSSEEAVPVSVAAVSPAIGLALLEQALATATPGIQCVIHIPRVVMPLLEDRVIVSGDGKTLVTTNGNLVVAGTGYDGRGPEETEPSDPMTPWIYATGPVYVNLGPVEVVTPQLDNAVNASTNVMTHVAVRPASAHWDGCAHFAAHLDLSMTPADGGTATDEVMGV